MGWMGLAMAAMKAKQKKDQQEQARKASASQPLSTGGGLATQQPYQYRPPAQVVPPPQQVVSPMAQPQPYTGDISREDPYGPQMSVQPPPVTMPSQQLYSSGPMSSNGPMSTMDGVDQGSSYSGGLMREWDGSGSPGGLDMDSKFSMGGMGGYNPGSI